MIRIEAARFERAGGFKPGFLGMKWAYVSSEVVRIIEDREGREFEAMGLVRQ